MPFTQEQLDAAVKAASEKAAKEAVDKALAAQTANFAKSLGIDADADVGEAVTKLQTQVKSGEETAKAAAKAEHDRAVDAIVAKYSADDQRRILPAQEPMIRQMLEGDLGEKVSFKAVDGKEIEGTRKDAVVAYLESLPQQYKLDESGTQEDPALAELLGGSTGVTGSEDIPADVVRFVTENSAEEEYGGLTIDKASVELNHKVLALMRKEKGLDYDGALCRLTGGVRIEEPFLPDNSIT